MNTVEIAEQIRLHKYNKNHFFGEQGKKVVDYILGRLLKYSGEMYEMNDTIAENTGVSKRTVQRTVKRMQEIQMISVAPRRKVCQVTGKTVQSSNLIRVLVYKALKLGNQIVIGAEKVVEKIVEVVEETTQKVGQAAAKVVQAAKRPFTRKPIRTEQKPDWLDKHTAEANAKMEQHSKAATMTLEEMQRQHEEFLLKMAEKKSK